MFRTTLLVAFLAILFLQLSADLTELTPEEYERRAAELTQRAERIRIETGFEAKIEYSAERMQLTRFQGRFPGISFPSQDYILQIELAFEQILSVLLPYIPVTRDQITTDMPVAEDEEVLMFYAQRADNYPIEGNPGLKMTYDYRTEKVTIENSLINIEPLPAIPEVTEEEALAIFHQKVRIPEHLEDTPFYRPRTQLKYCYDRADLDLPVNKRTYRLCWKLQIGEHEMRIDAVSGDVLSYKTLSE